MRYLIAAIASFIVAVGLVHLISTDGGFIIVSYRGQVFRTSLVFAVAAVVAVFVAIYVVIRLLVSTFTARTRLRRWSDDYRRKRSNRALTNATLALAEGNFARAERWFSHGVHTESVPVLHYLGAARAAHAQNATERRDTYLALADEALPKSSPAIAIQRAEMQVAEGAIGEAVESLEHLADRFPDNAQVLRLQFELLERTGDNEALVKLVPVLRRHRVFPADRLLQIESDVARRLLAGPFAEPVDLNRAWERLTKDVRANPSIEALYAARLAMLGGADEAEKMLRRHIGRQWNAALVSAYGDVRTQRISAQLERAQAWLREHSDSPELLLTLGKLALAAEDHAQAREYLEQSHALLPSPVALRLLADACDHLGDAAAASQARRDGLDLATMAVGSALVPATLA